MTQRELDLLWEIDRLKTVVVKLNEQLNKQDSKQDDDTITVKLTKLMKDQMDRCAWGDCDSSDCMDCPCCICLLNDV